MRADALNEFLWRLNSFLIQCLNKASHSYMIKIKKLISTHEAQFIVYYERGVEVEAKPF